MLTEQFAPKAETPDNTNNDPQIAGTIKILQEVKIPDKSEVGFTLIRIQGSFKPPIWLNWVSL